MTETTEGRESLESVAIQAMKESSGTVVTLGIATLIAGMLAIAAPFVAGTSVTILVAILMVAAGIARTIFACICLAGRLGSTCFSSGPAHGLADDL